LQKTTMRPTAIDRKMIYRRASGNDIPLLMPLLHEFAEQVPYPRCKIDEVHMPDFWKRLIDDEIGAIFMLMSDERVVGAIGGIVGPNPITGERETVEIFWYVQPSYRGLGVYLYKLFENWARNNGSKVLRMGFLHGVTPETIERLYDKLGLVKAETYFAKEL